MIYFESTYILIVRLFVRQYAAILTLAAYAIIFILVGCLLPCARAMEMTGTLPIHRRVKALLAAGALVALVLMLNACG